MHREHGHAFALVGALATLTGFATQASPADEPKDAASALLEQLKEPESTKRSEAAACSGAVAMGKISHLPEPRCHGEST